MSHPEAAILLTCQSLDDFPVDHQGEDADSLLACWTALWHPELIARCEKRPPWYAIDQLPDLAAEDRLLLVPRTSQGSIQPRLAAEWESQGVVSIYGETCRDQILQQILSSESGPTVEPTLADDFMALGYAYLQVHLLTRRMRYTPSMEESVFEASLVSGAKAAVQGDQETARQQLQTCFDLLSQERNHYYAADLFLLDLSLVSDRLPADSLEQQLAYHPKSDLLITAEQFESIADRSPDLREKLRSALETGQASIVGGEYGALPLPLLPIETIRGQLRRGLDIFQQQLQHRPRVFGRHHFGLTPALPQLLVYFGYRAALHATLDGGRFPEATQSKSRWEGDAQASLDALVRSPLDASLPETFLKLAASLSESMDMDHVATRVLAHWAGQPSRWYRDLLRVSHYTNALGRFVTVDEYFDQTYDPGLHDQFGPDQYHSPYLQQTVAAEHSRPISRYVHYWRRWGLVQSLCHCAALNLLLQDRPAARAIWQNAQEIAEQFAIGPLDDADGDERNAELERHVRQAAEDLARQMNSHASDSSRGTVVINPDCFPRRTVLHDPPLSSPPEDPPVVYAADLAGSPQRLVVDVPSMGAAWLADTGTRSRRKRATPSLADDCLLRNEFFEAQIDPGTGGLSALRDYRARGNRLSQQLAFRLDDTESRPDSSKKQSDTEPNYSRMVADSCEVKQSNAIVGEIVTRGQLKDHSGRALADYQQTFRMQRGSRVLELEIDLQPHETPNDNPWQSYFATRFAWNSEVAELARSYHELRCTTRARRLEAPLFVQIDDGTQKSTILTGGLPFHRRVGPRMLDTLLIVKGETQRRFRLGIGVDLKQPVREAIGFLKSLIVIDNASGVSSTRSAWLFHLDARNALITDCQPLLQDDRLVGVRMHVAETDGKSITVRMRSFRPFRSARKVDDTGQTANPCDVSDDEVRFALAAHELTVIEACFAD